MKRLLAKYMAYLALSVADICLRIANKQERNKK